MLSAKATSVIQYLVTDWWDEHGHPILNDHMPGGPWRIAAIVAVYVLFVKKIGPEFMKDREPFKIEPIMKLYNIANIIINTLLFIACMYLSNAMYEFWVCERINHSVSTRLWIGNGYMYLKIFDLLDTVFFVLRKKQTHVSGLHVWHHSSMPLLTWAAMKFYPLTPIGLTGVLNTFVHIVMYAYYYMAADPVLKKHLWWKKYITVIQLIQFAILLVNALVLLKISCGFPKPLLYAGIAQDLYFIYAFSSFYIKTYNKKEKST